MSNHDEIEVLIYDSPKDGVHEWRDSQGWRWDDRKPYVWYAEFEDSYTTGWLLTWPVFDDPAEEVEWFTTPLSKEPEGASIRTYDEAVGASRQYLLRRITGGSNSPPVVLPAEIEPGEFELTFMVDSYGESTPMEIHFTWDETSTANWWCDIWEGAPDLSPGSSAPAHGWASWLNGQDVLIAFTWPDVGVDGWAHIKGGAPGNGDFDALFEEETWVEFGKKILAAVHGSSLPGMTRQTYD